MVEVRPMEMASETNEIVELEEMFQMEGMLLLRIGLQSSLTEMTTLGLVSEEKPA
jgi:hypothetical protein